MTEEKKPKADTRLADAFQGIIGQLDGLEAELQEGVDTDALINRIASIKNAVQEIAP